MYPEPPTPTPDPSDARDDAFANQLDADLARIRTQLVNLDESRRALLDDEQRLRAERAAAREPQLPGVPE
jgi:hypothetical protein